MPLRKSGWSVKRDWAGQGASLGHVRNAPLATVGPKKATRRFGAKSDREHAQQKRKRSNGAEAISPSSKNAISRLRRGPQEVQRLRFKE
jgi:hypothetical protein